MSEVARSNVLGAAARRVLRCGTCHRVREATSAVLLRFTLEGWPRCCGEVMAYVTEAGPPAPGGTPPAARVSHGAT